MRSALYFEIHSDSSVQEHIAEVTDSPHDTAALLQIGGGHSMSERKWSR